MSVPLANFHQNQDVKIDAVDLCSSIRAFVCLVVQLDSRIMDLVGVFSRLTQPFALLGSIRKVLIVLRPVIRCSMRMMKRWHVKDAFQVVLSALMVIVVSNVTLERSLLVGHVWIPLVVLVHRFNTMGCAWQDVLWEHIVQEWHA